MRQPLMELSCASLGTQDHPVIEISDDVKRDRLGWMKVNADHTDKSARQSWAAEEITCGVFGVPQALLDTLSDVAGSD